MRIGLRLDWELARRGYRRYAAYPGATAAGLFTNVFFGLLTAYILLAVYDERVEVGGYDVKDALAYAWLAQALMTIVASFGPSWSELALRVRSGDISTDLRRPVDLQRSLASQDVGRAVYQAVFRAVPQFVFGALVFDVTIPADVWRWLLFAVSVCLALAVSFAVRFLVNLGAFWLLDYRGTMILALVVSHMLSGLIIPLTFFPGALAEIVRTLPFAAMLQAPIDLYVGEPLGGSVALVLGLQAAWAVVLVLAGRAVLRAGTRKLVIQGG
ncbi:MAG TPA: ABC-2 family transporter protein [Gaiellaceae bacterium]|nr:ABC-2 family transporter protein [Gaiellaceae bacterium]